LSFWVDPPGLVLFGAIIFIVSERWRFSQSMTYAISAATLASFTIGGIGLYLDWFRWVVPGIIDLQGSYVMLDQGITGLMKAKFPSWLVILFLSMYPFWFSLGYETAKRRALTSRVVPLLFFGILLLLIPSVIESNFLPH